jgi:hypothetical protein
MWLRRYNDLETPLDEETGGGVSDEFLVFDEQDGPAERRRNLGLLGLRNRYGLFFRMSTETAAAKANATPVPSPSQKPSVATASTMTTGTKTPEMRSASRWMVTLPICASVTRRPICANAVSLGPGTRYP